MTEVLAAAKKGAKVAYATNTQENHQHPTGLRKYVETHKAQYPGNDTLENQLNMWMVAFEEAEERKRLALEAAGDDGWTVVTRKAGRKRKSGVPSMPIVFQNCRLHDVAARCCFHTSWIIDGLRVPQFCREHSYWWRVTSCS